MSSRVLYWNANGLLHNLPDVKSLLTCPHPIDNEPPIDIVALAETHIHPRRGSNPYPIPGYNGWSLPHAGNSGGVAIYIRDTLIAKALPEFNYHDRATGASAAMWVSVRPFSRSRTVMLVAAVYVQPSTAARHLKALLDSLQRVIDAHPNHPIIIAGDFNSRDPHWGDTVISTMAPAVRRFLSDSATFTLNQHFIRGRATRPGNNPNERPVIDLVITNQPAMIGDMTIADRYGLHSDHLPLQVDIVRRPRDLIIDGPSNHLAGHRIQWRTRTTDWVRFEQHVSRSIVADSLTSPMPPPSDARSAQSIVDDRSRGILRVLMDAANTVVGAQAPSTNRKHFWSCPLVDVPAVYKAHRVAIARHKRSRPEDRAAAKADRDAARARWKAASKKAEKWNHAELLAAVQSAPHILDWIGFKRTLPGKGKVNLTSVTDEDGALPLTTDQSLFNFATAMFKAAVPPHRSSGHDEITARVASAARRYTINPTEDSLRWSCTAADVERICTHIDVRRAYGSDNVHPAFLKYGGKALYKALSISFNYSYRHSVIPLQWTQSLVVPLYKDGDRTKADSYRPISLTSCIMRTMEHLIQECLITLVGDRLHPYQYGFRPNHSTYNAIHHMLEDLHTVSRGYEHPATPVVFLDLRKAFDRVWHDGLLEMLRKRGVCGRIWLWLRAFISNRCSCVVNNGSSSGWFLQRYGVPQGAVLSPVLFNIFFDGLAEALNANPLTQHRFITLLKFADDTALYPDVRMDKWRQRLQVAMDILSTWARRWCMEFNSKKSQIVWFTRKRRYRPRSRFQLCNFTLESVSSYRYLGLQLSGDFTWTAHIGGLLKKACHDAFLVRRIIDHRSDKPVHFASVRSIAVSYLRPRWTYGLAFMPDTKSVRNWLGRAESELCSTIRAVLGLPRSTHKLSVLIEAGLTPMAVYASYQRLRAAYNMSQLPAGHATTNRYVSGLRAARADEEKWSADIASGRVQPKLRTLKDPSRIHSFYRVLLSIQSDWGVLHQSIDDITHKTVAAAYRHWTASPGGALLKSIKLYRDRRSVGRSHYLYLDSAVHARTRAAFRLDRIQTNGSMYRMNRGRIGTTQSPDCPCCPGIEESIPHIVNDCPLYSLHRAVVSHRIGVPIGPLFTNFVLGGSITDASVNSDARIAERRRELRLTGEFLVDILVTRRVPAR
jgi:hypothetical protein